MEAGTRGSDSCSAPGGQRGEGGEIDSVYLVQEAIHESVDLFDFWNCISVKLTLSMVCWYLS